MGLPSADLSEEVTGNTAIARLSSLNRKRRASIRDTLWLAYLDGLSDTELSHLALKLTGVART
jgi:hypothetical protein